MGSRLTLIGLLLGCAGRWASATTRRLTLKLWRIAWESLSSRSHPFVDVRPQCVEQLVNWDVGAFSASLLHIERVRVILVNDGHSVPRRNSNVAHEIAHALLCHPPQPFDHVNGRDFDQGVEAEANCLAGHILIPNAAALYIVRSGREAEARDRYGVSNQLLQWRLGASGARIRQQRWQRRGQPQALRAARRAPSVVPLGRAGLT